MKWGVQKVPIKSLRGGLSFFGGLFIYPSINIKDILNNENLTNLRKERGKMKKLITIITIICVMLCMVSVAGAGELWGTGSPDWGYGASGPSPVIFKFDTSTGIISTTFSFETYNWMWISGLADSGKYLYASHNTYDTASGVFWTRMTSRLPRSTGTREPFSRTHPSPDSWGRRTPR